MTRELHTPVSGVLRAFALGVATGFCGRIGTDFDGAAGRTAFRASPQQAGKIPPYSFPKAVLGLP